ncbi:hypothetical protein EBAPG3_15060 [Nitrosospira lacus]|uniref:Uncharacterized protein n=1 Tax=Nitrosospira lacus TaxID=1288494 RepID=A0A1W6SSN0_9PROT|nr:hypothetical protein EBAPG3_15060 [Nitrosospira lacus]
MFRIGSLKALLQCIQFFLYRSGLYFKGILLLFKNCPPRIIFVIAQGFLRIDQVLKLGLKGGDLGLLGFGCCAQSFLPFHNGRNPNSPEIQA